MVIYDKNQFTFNIVFVIILIASLFLNIYYSTNFKILENRFISLNNTLGKVEENQNFNFIQGGHTQIDYSLTEHGVLISSADNYGKFSGPSMQPSIFDQNTLIEQEYDMEPLQAGQIIRFMRGNQAVIHRVRADYGETVYVQGDSLKDGEIISKALITHVVIGILFT
ncbi:MAG: S24/S26 family peptidase [archaeon]